MPSRREVLEGIIESFDEHNCWDEDFKKELATAIIRSEVEMLEGLKNKYDGDPGKLSGAEYADCMNIVIDALINDLNKEGSE